MSKIHYFSSMSLDGFVAGPNQSKENPLGINGHLLHEWMRKLTVWRKQAGFEGGETNANTQVFLKKDFEDGAIIMGRNMFGGGPGPWKEPIWKGWWGDNPPFHLPVYVVTHYPRPTLEMEGNNTFTFVTEGIETALELARKSANGKDIAIYGGGTIAKQFIAAGLVDEITIHLIPVFLGAGVKLFDSDSLTYVKLEQTHVMEGPGAVHLKYKILK